jgi:hypothetical protein
MRRAEPRMPLALPGCPTSTLVRSTDPQFVDKVVDVVGLYLTDKLIRRGVHTSVKALEDDIKAWIDTWNENPRPFTWAETAGEILKSLTDCLTKINPPDSPSE